MMQKFQAGKGGPVLITGSSLEGAALAMVIIGNTYHEEGMTGERVADVVVGW